jgi:hypothetical protein
MARKKQKSAKPTAPAKVQAKPAAKQKEKVSQAEIDTLARRTLNLWRDQMMKLAQSPQALREMTKVMEPSYKLFTQSLDMWLMMFDHAGKGMYAPQWAAPFTGAGTGKSSNSAAGGKAKNEPKTQSASAPRRAKSSGSKSGSGKSASGAKAASAVSRSGEIGRAHV